MAKSKWLYICLIGLSIMVMILSVPPLFMKAPIEESTSNSEKFPPFGEMPAGGMPGAELPNNLDQFEVQKFMKEVEEQGGLTPELEQKAKEMGLPDQMIQMLGSAKPVEPTKELNIVSLSAMIMGTIVIGFSSYRLFKLKRHNRKSVL